MSLLWQQLNCLLSYKFFAVLCLQWCCSVFTLVLLVFEHFEDVSVTIFQSLNFKFML